MTRGRNQTGEIGMVSGRKLGTAAMVGLCAGIASTGIATVGLTETGLAETGLADARTTDAGGLACHPADVATTESAALLCRAVAAALADSAVSPDGLLLEVTAARTGLVAARMHRNGAAGPVVQMVAIDGPLLPDWPERMAADLLRATPPP